MKSEEERWVRNKEIPMAQLARALVETKYRCHSKYSDLQNNNMD